MLYAETQDRVTYRPETHKTYKTSAAEKLYDIIVAAPTLKPEVQRAFWNLENRIYAVNKIVRIMRMQQFSEKESDLETLMSCVEQLEKKADSSHWQKAFGDPNRILKRSYVDSAISSIKDYGSSRNVLMVYAAGL
ncbi:MAG: hypothetical protein ABIA62_00385 [Candidatus Woesearchaeota archaeon]